MFVYVYRCVCHSYLFVNIKGDLKSLFLIRDALHRHLLCFSKYTRVGPTSGSLIQYGGQVRAYLGKNTLNTYNNTSLVKKQSSLKRDDCFSKVLKFRFARQHRFGACGSRLKCKDSIVFLLCKLLFWKL